MASSSLNSSSSTPNLSTNYDVFLSFRGIDTRNSFRSHLKVALRKKKIETFTDDQDMEIGEDVWPQLIQAIENSSCSILIISPQYASSKWCLIELVKILDCMKGRGQIVIPIFYNVKPCDVGNQTGEFGMVFERRQEASDVESWRKALAEVAGLPGFELQDGDEAQFIREIVEEVSRKLNAVASSNISDNLSVLNPRVNVTRFLSYSSTWLHAWAKFVLLFFFFLLSLVGDGYLDFVII